MPTEAEIAAVEAADAEEEMFEEWANTQDGDFLDLDQYERMREKSEWLSLVS